MAARALLTRAGVEAADQAAVQAKLAALAEGGGERLQLIVDFDYTISRAHRDGAPVDCSWGVLENFPELPSTYTQQVATCTCTCTCTYNCTYTCAYTCTCTSTCTITCTRTCENAGFSHVGLGHGVGEHVVEVGRLGGLLVHGQSVDLALHQVRHGGAGAALPRPLPPPLVEPLQPNVCNQGEKERSDQ